MPLVGASVASFDTIVECVRLKTHDWPLEDRLTGAYTSGGGVLAVSDGTQFEVGDEVEIDDAFQSIYLVRSISSNNLTVKTGHRGSTEADHASGAVVRKRPRFTRQDIEEAGSHVVDALAPEVYDVNTTNITYSSTADYYAAPTDFIAPISAVQKGTEATNVSYTPYSFGQPHSGYYGIQIIRGAAAADFASGIAFYPSGWANTTNVITVTYTRKVTTSTISTGLMADAVCWGIVDQLLSSSMIHRSSPAFEGDPETTSALDSLRGSLQADRHFRNAKTRLKVELAQTYRPVGRWIW